MSDKRGYEQSHDEHAMNLLQRTFIHESIEYLREKIGFIEFDTDKINQEMIIRASVDLFSKIGVSDEFPVLGSPEWWPTMIDKVKEYLKQRKYCQLQRKTWLGESFDTEINPGNLPANYQNSWIIQTKDIGSFKLFFEEIDLDWAGGDRIMIYGAELDNKKKWVFTSLMDIQNHIVPCNLTLDDSEPYIKFYLILETGPGSVSRKFRLWGLEVISLLSESCEVVLASDDLDYTDSSKPLIRAYTTQGKSISLDKPWNKATSQLVAGPLPVLNPENGWYLLGKNINSNPEEMTFQKFFSFVFYNERTGYLRAYLFNHDFDDTDVTGYTVTFSIWCEGDQQPLDGAIFPVDPKPDRWGSVTIPICHSWRKGSWAFVETPILYPMIKNLPGKENGPFGSEPDALVAVVPFLNAHQNEIYDSLYEDTTEGGSNNFKLRLTIQPYQKGLIDLDIFGKALGTAIQDGGGSSNIISILKKGKGVIDYYSMGQKYYGSVNKALGAAATTGLIAPLMAIGSTGWGAAFAVVGLISAILSREKQLQLSLELAIRAQAQGQVIIHGTEYEHEFYLPGKFNIQKAYANGLQKFSIPDYIARYDRPIGNFGVRYLPALLTFPVTIIGYDHLGSVYTTFPVKNVHKAGKSENIGDNKIEWWLPIIYNPYSDIVMIDPCVIDGDINLNQALFEDYENKYSHIPWFHFIQDLSPTHCISPEIDDLQFPKGFKKGKGTRLFIHVFGPSDQESFFLEKAIWINQAMNPHIDDITGLPLWQQQDYKPSDVRDNSEGIWLEICPVKFTRNLSSMTVTQEPIKISTYREFSHIRNVFSHAFWEPIFSVLEKGSAKLDNDSMSRWYPGESNQSKIPLDVLFCHEQKYFYYGRTRKTHGKVILEEHCMPIYAQVPIKPLDHSWVIIKVSGGGGWRWG